MPYACSHCGEEFETVGRWQYHIRSVHRHSVSYTISGVRFEFSRNSAGLFPSLCGRDLTASSLAKHKFVCKTCRTNAKTFKGRDGIRRLAAPGRRARTGTNGTTAAARAKAPAPTFTRTNKTPSSAEEEFEFGHDTGDLTASFCDETLVDRATHDHTTPRQRSCHSKTQKPADEKSKDPNTLYACSQCLQRFRSKSQREGHTRSAHQLNNTVVFEGTELEFSRGTSGLFTSFCGKSFTLAYLGMHISKCSACRAKALTLKKEKDAQPKFKTTTASGNASASTSKSQQKAAVSSSDKRLHLSENSSPEAYCTRCSEEFETQTERRNHVCSANQLVKSFVFEGMKLVFSRESTTNSFPSFCGERLSAMDIRQHLSRCNRCCSIARTYKDDRNHRTSKTIHVVPHARTFATRADTASRTPLPAVSVPSRSRSPLSSSSDRPSKRRLISCSQCSAKFDTANDRSYHVRLEHQDTKSIAVAGTKLVFRRDKSTGLFATFCGEKMTISSLTNHASRCMLCRSEARTLRSGGAEEDRETASDRLTQAASDPVAAAVADYKARKAQKQSVLSYIYSQILGRLEYVSSDSESDSGI